MWEVWAYSAQGAQYFCSEFDDKDGALAAARTWLKQGYIPVVHPDYPTITILVPAHGGEVRALYVKEDVLEPTVEPTV